VRFLRTVPTRSLLAVIAGLVAAIAGGTAIAIAASGGGPVPRHESLARALRRALTAPAPRGISARVEFANHLIDSSDIQGSDPLLQGGSGRLWLSPSTHQLRIELQSDSGDVQALVSGRSAWLYDPSSNTVYEGTLPAHKLEHRNEGGPPSPAQIQSDLNRLAKHLNLSGAAPSDVAGQPAYTVRVSPKRNGGLLGGAELAWDAVRGVPLRFAIYARGDNSPVLELKVTDVSYGSVPASDFAIAPPSDAKVVRVSSPASHARRERTSFQAVAPKALAGLQRESVRTFGRGAFVSYGHTLVVLEQSGGSRARPAHLSLPTISVNGATAQKLDTPLGTMIRFTRGGISYTVLGSVPPATAVAAARGL
jgi:outer membrane lipoprotein-sorting protein